MKPDYDEAACERQLYLDCRPGPETERPEDEAPRRQRPHPLVLLFLTINALAVMIFIFKVAGAAMLGLRC